MRDLLRQLLSGQNQFASGGLLLMIVGSVGLFLRSLPWRIWWLIVEQSTMTITVKDEDAAFRWVKEWFLEQPFLNRVRQVDLDTTLRGTELALIQGLLLALEQDWASLEAVETCSQLR